MYYGFKSPCICFVKEDYWLIIDEEKAPINWVPFSLCIYPIIAKTSHFASVCMRAVELTVRPTNMKQKLKLLSSGLTHRFIRVKPLEQNRMETTT